MNPVIPTLTLIVPIYNEAPGLPELFTRLTEIGLRIEVPFEIVLVNDGSIDESATLLNGFSKTFAQARIVHLSRNFGQQAAFSAGLDHALGRAVILMDADLQDDPEAVFTFIQKWKAGYDVVYAIRKDRKERTSKRWAYTIFYKILSWLADSPIQRDAGDFCLLDRKVVDRIRLMPEYHRFLRGMRSWVGFKQIGIPVERHARFAGSPKYTVRKLLKLAFDGFTSSSILPLRAITFIGLFLSLASVVMGGVYLWLKLTTGLGPPGFATLVVIVCFFSGVQMMLLGVVAEYLGRVFEQVRGRPTYIVQEVVERESSATNLNAQ